MMGVVAISHHTLQFNVSKFLNNLLVLLKKKFHMPNKNCIFRKVVPSLECGLIKKERERDSERERERENQKSG